MAQSTSRLRKAELVVLLAGVLFALAAVGSGSGEAFRANTAWTRGSERLGAILFTVASLIIVGALAIAPYALLAWLGKRMASDGEVGWRQIAGFTISCAITLASAYLYRDALYTVTHDRSSTAGLVFVAIPMALLAAGGGSYGFLTLLHSRAQKPQGGAD